MPTYQGVDVDHPRIVEAIKTLTRRRRPDGTRFSTADKMKLVGMPYEVVRRIELEAEKGRK
jgi:hypothetical protein